MRHDAMPAPRVPRGITLVELIVTLALLGLLAGVVGLTLRTTPHVPALDATTAQLLAARDSALRTGRPVTITLTGVSLDAGARHDDDGLASPANGLAAQATALPDGRIVASGTIAIDPLSGSARDAAP
ncbi:MAG: prepilin-type N-terminal cleavage/methylation domain-containing protein [Gemmatimonadaceae bacterium]|nr:prepilin-type N-terminal cleavage/methylation domain-containing protein [Gemmatimonadaceae bacterium]